MVRKYLTCFLMLLLLNPPLFAQTRAEKKAAQEGGRIAQIKATLQSYGTGVDALVEVNRKHGKKVKGYLSEVKEDLFVVANTAAATSHEVRYGEVNAVKPWKLPAGGDTKKMVLIGVVIGIGVTALAIYCVQRLQALGARGQDLRR